MRKMPLELPDQEIGHAFHEALHELAPWANHHPEHAEHDVVVGRTVRLAMSGAIDDAVRGYNAWARGAGYAAISAMPGNRVDIQDCVLRIEGDAFCVEPRAVLVDDPDRIDVAGLEPPIPENWGIHSVLLGWRSWVGDGFMFMLVPQPDGTAEVHSRFRPGLPILRAVRAGREVIRREWVAGCRLVGRTPKDSPQIYRFSLACGMELVSETAEEWYTTAVGGA